MPPSSPGHEAQSLKGCPVYWGPADLWTAGQGPSRSQPGGRHLAYARQLDPAGGEGVLAGGRAPVPGSSSLCPLGPQLPYARVIPSGGAANGARGVAGPGWSWLSFWRRGQVPATGALFGDGGLERAWRRPCLLSRVCRSASLQAFDPTVFSAGTPLPSGADLGHPSRPSRTPPHVRSWP